MREITVIFDPERKLILYFTVIVFAILVGPFGTYDAMSFWQRVIFWSLDILGGMAIILPILHVFYASRFVREIPSLPRMIGGIMLGAIPAAAYVTLLFNAIGPKIVIPTPYPLLYLEMVMFSTVLLLTEFIFWPIVFGAGPKAPPPQTTPAPAQPVQQAQPVQPVPPASLPRLIERLPPDLRHAKILSISMQDHYAQIVTDKGEHLLLIRLSDAIDLLDGLAGMQIHRSHWVAQSNAQSLTRNGRRHDLLTTDGRILPVSATRIEALKHMLASTA